jgi:DNA-binding SARP family transcriptional activator
MGKTCQVRLLGGLSVELDGTAVTWRKPADADLVAVLALSPGYRLRRDDVAHRLWPGAGSREAGKLLDHAVKDVRKAFRDDRAVTLDGGDLRLWPHGALSVDVHTFLATAKHARRLDQWEEAVELYTGELLPAHRDKPWTEPLRTRAHLAFLELRGDLQGAPAAIDLRDRAARPA